MLDDFVQSRTCEEYFKESIYNKRAAKCRPLFLGDNMKKFFIFILMIIFVGFLPHSIHAEEPALSINISFQTVGEAIPTPIPTPRVVPLIDETQNVVEVTPQPAVEVKEEEPILTISIIDLEEPLQPSVGNPVINPSNIIVSSSTSITETERKVSIVLAPGIKTPISLGDFVSIVCVLEGFDGIEVHYQWEVSYDRGISWNVLKNEKWFVYSFFVNNENLHYFYRVGVIYATNTDVK